MVKSKESLAEELKKLKIGDVDEQASGSETNTPTKFRTPKKNRAPKKSNESPAKELKIGDVDEQTSGLESNTPTKFRIPRKVKTWTKSEKSESPAKKLKMDEIDDSSGKSTPMKGTGSEKLEIASKSKNTHPFQVPSDSLKDRIANQMHAQLAKIEGCDADAENFQKLKAANNYIKLTSLSGEGKCLFAALHYQLNLFVESDDKQEEHIRLFRAEVVNHIKNNLDVFRKDLEKRITESNRKFTKRSINKEFVSFLDHLGSDEGVGGIETIRSVSMMNNVNIISVGPNRSGFVPCHFNSNHTRCLLILQIGDLNRSIHFMSDDIVEKVSKAISEAGDNES